MRHSQPIPIYIQNLSTDEKITKVEAGMYNTLFLSDQGRVFSLGCTIGGDVDQFSSTPTIVEFPDLLPEEKIIEISSSGYHCLALTNLGYVYGWIEY